MKKKATKKKAAAKARSNAELLRQARPQKTPAPADANDAAADVWIEGRRGPGRPRGTVDKKPLHVRIPAVLHKKVHVRAREEERPVASIVEELLTEWLTR